MTPMEWHASSDADGDQSDRDESALDGTVSGSDIDVALQNELGVDSRMIDVAEARRLSPLIDTDGLLAAAFSPDDGHCTPESVVRYWPMPS